MTLLDLRSPFVCRNYLASIKRNDHEFAIDKDLEEECRGLFKDILVFECARSESQETDHHYLQYHCDIVTDHTKGSTGVRILD
jgi:hypothetical protein